MNVTKEVEKLYGNRLRLRVCGICIQDKSLLLVQHRGLGPSDEFWSPPGGGMEWGSTAEQNVEREFLEETGLQVAVGPLLFVWEHLGPPLHAIELFFEVSVLGGSLRTGADPESPPHAQLIRNVSFMDWDRIKALPASNLHRAIQQCASLEDLKNRYGYFKFCV